MNRIHTKTIKEYGNKFVNALGTHRYSVYGNMIQYNVSCYGT